AVAELMAKIKPSFLLHLAWYVEHGDFWRSSENLRWVTTSLNLVQEFIKNGGERLVAAGTCAEYDWTESLCSEASTAIKPNSLYGSSKASLETILSIFARDKGISFAWGRLFFPYGPNEGPKRLIPSMILSLLNNQVFACKNPGLERDFIFVDDVAAIFSTMMDSRIEGPVNLGSGRPVKLGAVVELIAKSLNAEHLVRYQHPSPPSPDPPV